MPLPISRYVDITSGVGAGASVRNRQLIGRLFTTNPLVPTKGFVEFETADAVATYFGALSEEYKRAAFYFGWINKLIQRAPKISFARWVNAAIEPRIYGRPQPQSLTFWNTITSGGFSLTLGSNTFAISGLNFSTDTTLAAIATRIQTAIRAQTSGGALWTSATVSYDAVRQSFNLVGGLTGSATVQVSAASSGTDIAGSLGWLNGAIDSDGSAAETITQTLLQSAEASNNFGSFAFMPALTLPQVIEAATWNDAYRPNVMFQYHVPVTAANAAAWSAALIGYGGVGLTLAGIADEYHEMIPVTILAATDYAKRGAAQNYMFNIFGGLTPTVNTVADGNVYDALRVNYYGRSQTAGQLLDFYQRSVLMGTATDPVDMNTYANEQWLKDEAASAIMGLLLSLAKVSANSQGRAQLMSVLQGVVEKALFNGTISVGKTLNTTQRLYVTQITGDDLAWLQVQNKGFWFDVTFETVVTSDGRTEYKAVYTFLYSKDDTIRKVDGTHILI